MWRGDAAHHRLPLWVPTLPVWLGYRTVAVVFLGVSSFLRGLLPQFCSGWWSLLKIYAGTFVTAAFAPVALAVVFAIAAQLLQTIRGLLPRAACCCPSPSRCTGPGTCCAGRPSCLRPRTND